MFARNIINRRIVNIKPTCSHVRYFWEYVNMMFNRPDPQRLKLVGPDRACAEWVLRNGGKIVWANGEKLADFNSLPPDNIPVPKLAEIDGSESSISHYGFSHLSGCEKLSKVILNKAKYIEDQALQGLSYGSSTLKEVVVSNILDVSDNGVKSLETLKKLDKLTLHNLSNVKDIAECKNFLQAQLPKCNIIAD